MCGAVYRVASVPSLMHTALTDRGRTDVVDVK
jgi:hypothetical protein